ncbi:MAG: nodulation protein NodZ [Parachlamydiaceae bacterium]
MKKLILIFVLIALILGFAYYYRASRQPPRITSTEPNGKLLVYNTGNSGMFAVFSGVLGALNFYEQGEFQGIEIALEGGVYQDPKLGPNWWTYFFAPIHVGNNQASTYTFTFEDHRALAHDGFHMPRQRAHELISKYIKVLPHIQNKVDLFVKERFQDHYVIGVHHRGTDKVTEMPLVSFDKTAKALAGVIEKLPKEQHAHLKIYAATDDSHFIEFLSTIYPDQVIFNDFVRSEDNQPLHIGNDEKYGSIYQKGEEALVDCLLLSRCNHLIRPWSSLSIVADHFNPNMPITTLWGHK